VDSPRYRPTNNGGNVCHRLVEKEEEMIVALTCLCEDCGVIYQVPIEIIGTPEQASQGQVTITFGLKGEPDWTHLHVGEGNAGV
jgi:predicted NUDIX family NTP pyrophosphohydrolase